MNSIYILFALFVLLQVADAYTTIMSIKSGAKEANPVMSAVFKITGVPMGLALIKLALIALVYKFLMFYPLIVIDLIYLAVVANNVKVMKSVKK